jgi:hypothetical protein
VKSSELVFTVTKDLSALQGGGIPFDTKLRFTDKTGASTATVAAQPAPAPPSASASPAGRLDVDIAVNYSTTPNPAAVEEFQKRIDQTT